MNKGALTLGDPYRARRSLGAVRQTVPAWRGGCSGTAKANLASCDYALKLSFTQFCRWPFSALFILPGWHQQQAKEQQEAGDADQETGEWLWQSQRQAQRRTYCPQRRNSGDHYQYTSRSRTSYSMTDSIWIQMTQPSCYWLSCLAKVTNKELALFQQKLEEEVKKDQKEKKANHEVLRALKVEIEELVEEHGRWDWDLGHYYVSCMCLFKDVTCNTLCKTLIKQKKQQLPWAPAAYI